MTLKRLFFAVTFVLMFICLVDLHAQTVDATSGSYPVNLYWADGSKTSRRSPTIVLDWLVGFHSDLPNGVYQVRYNRSGVGNFVVDITNDGNPNARHTIRETSVGVGFTSGSKIRTITITRKSTGEVVGSNSFTFVGEFTDTVYYGGIPVLTLTTLPYIIGAPVIENPIDIDFPFSVDNQRENPVFGRLVVDGVVKWSQTFGAKTSESGNVTLPFQPGEGGSYHWEFSLDGTNWTSTPDDTFMAPVDGNPGKMPIPQNASFTPDPEPEPSPTPPSIPETPDPDIPATPKPTPPPPDGDTSPPPSGAGSGPNGEIQKEDIYASVKKAIEDALKKVDGGGGIGGDEGGGVGNPTLHEGGDELKKGKELAGQIYEKYQEVTTGMDEVRAIHKSKLEEFAAVLQSAPSSFGSVTSVHLGTMPVVGSLSVDFSTLPSETIRLLFLWILRFMVFLAYLRLLLS